MTFNATTENKDNPQGIIATFNKHFVGETKEFCESFKFNKRDQESGESIDQYIAALRNLEKSFVSECEKKLLMDQIINGVRCGKKQRETDFATPIRFDKDHRYMLGNGSCTSTDSSNGSKRLCHRGATQSRQETR